MKNPLLIAFIAGMLYMYAVLLYMDQTNEEDKVYLPTESDTGSDDGEKTDKAPIKSKRRNHTRKTTSGNSLQTSVSPA